MTPLGAVGRHRRRIAVGVLAAPWALWAIMRALALDLGHPLVALIGFTPYVAATAFVPLVVALAAREWVLAGLAAVALTALAVAVAPRALDGPQPDGLKDGRTLTVMSANLQYGAGDADALMRLVRERDVDVLSLQELTPDAVARLDHAGARELLPGRTLRALPRASGIGLMARRALRRVSSPDDVGRRWAAQLRADVRPAGGGALGVVAVHPFPPISIRSARRWRDVLRTLPEPFADRRPQLLLGDFNATLDHRELRRLLDRGYVDAADATGAGLRPTWPVGDPRPLLTLDHVLVAPTIGVRKVTFHDLPGSDHRAVIVELVLPEP